MPTLSVKNITATIAARKAISDLNKSRLDCYLDVLSHLTQDIKDQAIENINLLENKGSCWSGYILGWRNILKSESPGEALLNTDGELNAFLQNSPLAFCMSKKPLEDYANSLKE